MTDLFAEIWRPVVGYEREYVVSDEGRVKSVVGRYTGRVLGVRLTNVGYRSVCLTKDGSTKTMLLHRILAKAFIPAIAGADFVNHKDGDKLNNALYNLEWVTKSENSLHAYRTGLSRRRNAKLTPEIARQIKNILAAKTHTQKQIAKQFGVSRSAVQQIVLGNNWK